MEKQEWAYHGALWNTTVHWNGPRVFSTDVCFNPTHDDIIKTEGLHGRVKKSVVDVVKGICKINEDNINCVSLVHHARHRFLEDQQIGWTGPTR